MLFAYIFIFLIIVTISNFLQVFSKHTSVLDQLCCHWVVSTSFFSQIVSFIYCIVNQFIIVQLDFSQLVLTSLSFLCFWFTFKSVSIKASVQSVLTSSVGIRCQKHKTKYILIPNSVNIRVSLQGVGVSSMMTLGI